MIEASKETNIKDSKLQKIPYIQYLAQFGL